MRSIQRNAFGVAAIAVAFASLTMFARPALVLGRVVERFDTIPLEAGEWNGLDVDPGNANSLLPNSSILMRDYYNYDQRRANLSIVYGLDIAEIHNPERCFEGQGWTTIWRKTVRLLPAVGPEHAVRLALLRTSEGQTICAYWYAGPNGARASLPGERWESWKSALLTAKVRPSALVRILVPVTAGQQTAEYDALSLAFYLDASIQKMVSRQPTIVRARGPIGE